MSAVEDAALLRRIADDFAGRGWAIQERAAREAADRLDPPKPALPTAFGWHAGVRHKSIGDELLPGALHDITGWRLVHPSGQWAHYAEGVDAEQYLIAVEPEPAREPRVLVAGDPCPEVGSRWRDQVGDVCEVTEPGEYVWIELGPSGRRGQESWRWQKHASYDRRLTEVLA